jgi:hypothetical protein
MRRFISGHKKVSTVVTTFLVLALALWAWDTSGSIRGQIVARYDLARGHYRIFVVGLPVVYRPEYGRLLHERFGVEMRVAAGCVVTDSLLAYVDGYDRTSMAATNRKWGRDVFQESFEEAGRVWSQTHPRKKK